MKSVKARPAAARVLGRKTKAARVPSLEDRVLDVVTRHPGWDAAQVAADLGEDLFAVVDVVQALIERGAVGEKR